MPRRKVTATLSNLHKFLKNELKGREHTTFLEDDMKKVLQRTLKQVFASHNKTYYIPDKQSLARRIKTNDTTPDGAKYSEKYLAKKRKMGETRPHKFMNYAFWNGIEVVSGGYKTQVGLRFSNPGIVGKQFNYVFHHEERRSVLKATMLLAFEALVQTMLENYGLYIKKGL